MPMLNSLPYTSNIFGVKNSRIKCKVMLEKSFCYFIKSSEGINLWISISLAAILIFSKIRFFRKKYLSKVNDNRITVESVTRHRGKDFITGYPNVNVSRKLDNNMGIQIWVRYPVYLKAFCGF